MKVLKSLIIRHEPWRGQVSHWYISLSGSRRVLRSGPLLIAPYPVVPLLAGLFPTSCCWVITESRLKSECCPISVPVTQRVFTLLEVKCCWHAACFKPRLYREITKSVRILFTSVSLCVFICFKMCFSLCSCVRMFMLMVECTAGKYLLALSQVPNHLFLFFLFINSPGNHWDQKWNYEIHKWGCRGNRLLIIIRKYNSKCSP